MLNNPFKQCITGKGMTAGSGAKFVTENEYKKNYIDIGKKPAGRAGHEPELMPSRFLYQYSKSVNNTYSQGQASNSISAIENSVLKRTCVKKHKEDVICEINHSKRNKETSKTIHM